MLKYEHKSIKIIQFSSNKSQNILMKNIWLNIAIPDYSLQTLKKHKHNLRENIWDLLKNNVRLLPSQEKKLRIRKSFNLVSIESLCCQRGTTEKHDILTYMYCL